MRTLPRSRMINRMSDRILARMSLPQLLDWYGSDLGVGQSLAGFNTAIKGLKRWHKIHQTGRQIRITTRNFARGLARQERRSHP